LTLTRQTTDLRSFAKQAEEHEHVLRELLACDAPPELDRIRDVTRATRALRGSASLIGLDAFQAFLGRLFALLVDVESSELPWSADLGVVLGEALEAEDAYVEALAQGDAAASTNDVSSAEAKLATWRREAVRRYESTVAASDLEQAAPAADASPSTAQTVNSLVRQVRTLRAGLNATEPVVELPSSLTTLATELVALGQALQGIRTPEPGVAEEFEEGLRNHCEGVLRQLVESAAREVLDEAHERGSRLALRATGSLGSVDDELGGALLEILRNLWSDSLRAQGFKREAQIDSVVRVEEDRLVVEVRDPDAARGNASSADEEVLSRYTGLRRLRPLVQSLQGLVWVEPESGSECRFRVSLPRAVAPTQGQVVRVGAHQVVVPPSAVEAVYAYEDVQLQHDRAGAVVEVDGFRHPVLHLAFVLQDVSYDELERELVVVVGSFERRAALLASGPCRSVSGDLEPGPEGPWCGTLVVEGEELPLLDMGALLGRRRAVVAQRSENGDAPATEEGITRALVVNSSELERVTLAGLLEESGWRCRAVQSAEEAWELLQKESVELLVCDLRLPEMNAQRIAELRRSTGRFADIPVVIVLSHAGEQSHLVVQQIGARDFVRSPIQREELMAIVQRLAPRS
jgi:CheY-like chemotaxis protein